MILHILKEYAVILKGLRSVKMTLTTKWNFVISFWKGGRGRRICEQC